MFEYTAGVEAVDKNISRKAAGYPRHDEARGRKIGLVDAVIAASAVINNMILVTYNLKHYPMPELVKKAPSRFPI